MRRARWILAVICAAAALTAAVALLAVDGAPRAAEPDSCSPINESTFTAENLHDLRSFSDAMAIVTAVGEETPPPPPGPEGHAGLIGRIVSVRVDEVLWRRPNAPEPRRRFRFGDWGWVGEPDDRVPIRVCSVTRMEVGTTYLAPIARIHGTWYPFEEVRLRLSGDMVVGGVDGGTPNHAHHALIGRPVESAVRMVARTKPYRAVVRDPRESPARRWQAVDSDGYRIWRSPPGTRQAVWSGVTSDARYELYVRSPRPARTCIGLEARPLWDEAGTVTKEDCGPSGLARRGVTIETFSPAGLGSFAYGRGGRRVGTVRVRVAGGRGRKVPTIYTPSPPGGRERFWLAPLGDRCGKVSVQVLGWRVLRPGGERRGARLGEPGCG
jgi:hypothetical protein